MRNDVSPQRAFGLNIRPLIPRVARDNPALGTALAYIQDAVDQIERNLFALQQDTASTSAGETTVTFEDDRTPSGTVNGVNTTFVLPTTPNPPGSLLLKVNGVTQARNADYTLSGATITMTVPPHTGDVLRAWYRR